MRNFKCYIADLRKRVFAEVARLAYEGGDYRRMEKLPYEIVPGEVGNQRSSIFLERAIVGERIRLAMGLPLRPVAEHSLLSDGIEESAVAEKYYDPPLVNIIKYACNGCKPTHYEVTNACQGCLSRHCQNACPKDAIDIDRSGHACIDQSKCIKCGKCAAQCPYHAIAKIERPCAAACGMDAIESDEKGRAKINYDKCVSCGMCLVNCPFAAIADKSQIFQIIHAMKHHDEVIACVAPAFVSQFGKDATPAKLKAAMRRCGFADVVEVAIGADLCTIEEAKDFLEKVPGEQDYMATSCCPAWHSMIGKLFPSESKKISMTLTPMVFTARLMKKEHPGCKVVFVGPCAAKKLEAIRADIRSDVDFVLTFEELMGMFEAKEIDFAALEESEGLNEGTGAGRGFAVAGGVAQAVTNLVNETHPDLEVKTARAEGLRDCRKLMMMAKAGKYKGYLLEGMACPGGCVAGAGTILPVDKAAKFVEKYSKEAANASPTQSAYRDAGEDLD